MSKKVCMASFPILCLFAAWISVSVPFSHADEIPGNETLERLRLDLDRIFTEDKFEGSNWGVQVFSLDRETCLYERNPNLLLIPASNMKIVTSAVALMRLGPDYRFRTLLLTDGDIVDGVLDGNLIVVGYGDPSISSEKPEEDPLRTFRNWACKLKEKGIHKISGDILGDGSSFEHSMLGKGWEWDDLTEGYAAPINALQFNRNRMWIEIAPRNNRGSAPSVSLSPLPRYWIVENKLQVRNENEKTNILIERNDSDEILIIRGSIPSGKSKTYKEVAVENPIRWYLTSLKHALELEQIEVSACGTREIERINPNSMKQLELHLSDPLSDIMKPLLKESLNLYSETLLRALGLELNGSGSFLGGKEIVEETLERMAIDGDRYSYADGSGLSRLNLLSAEELVRVLRSMYRHPYFDYFYDALAIAGIDGTLENRLRGTPAEANLRAKTGSLSRVSAISGYLKTVDGEMLAISMIANNYLVPKSEADAAQDRAIVRLTKFKREASADHP
ncbi:MAG: D-alanyl-D-alanine carboxypeptidase/D-alanyl-D-alanine-endopeptidase [Acidobacteriota bacterium]